MQVLYDRGYEQYKPRHPACRPALIALRSTSLPCARLAVAESGTPEAELIDSVAAAYAGEDMLV